ncbi:TraR/DksA family transcriptional regulator [Streptomyces sp. NPDC017254]|uniref:TraR/DksA family transcriptional regulator n=1 Tax=unclassified Streptomyces TaxID=2593676 RepID=UPI0037B9AF08
MVAKKTAAKKPSAAGSTGTGEGAKDVAGKKTTVGEPPTVAEQTPAARKSVAKRPVAKKDAVRKTAAKKAAAEETDALTSVDGDADAGEPAAGHDADGKTPAKKAVAKKAAAKRAPAAKNAKKQTGARTVAAKKTAGGVTTAADEAGVPPARTGELAVRPGEDPWTPAEVTEARTMLQSEVLRLRSELAHSQEELTGLMRDSGDGAGDDQADTGTKNITREHELALAANAREMLEQSEHALERLDSGTYGLCEVCGKPIGKARMQAFPRATLCVEDKQRQERRG